MNIKKHINRGLRGLVLALFASVSAHAASGDYDRLEERDWHDARARDTLDAYERYLELHPLGPNAAEAFRRAMSSAPMIQPAHASVARPSRTAEKGWLHGLWRSVKNVLLFPLSMSSAKAQDSSRLDQEALEWDRALRTNTVEAFMSFLEKYPNGSYSGMASSCITDRRFCDHLQKVQPIYQ